MSVRLENVSKTFHGPDGSRVPVIDVPSFALAPGARVALIGSSGCGKTTLLHLIAGILVPDTGSIIFDIAEQAGPGEATQVDIAQLSEAKRDVFRGRNI